jgi:hypothetical protein
MTPDGDGDHDFTLLTGSAGNIHSALITSAQPRAPSAASR